MKKLLCAILVICLLVSMSACGSKPQEAVTGFKPALDTGTSCKITIAGSYDNFEALEAEFDRFNEMYPNVQLSYVKLDDYNNILATALDSNDKPNIFFSYTWMIGNEKYAPVVAHMEDLSDSALGIDISCIRSSLVNKGADGSVLLVPVFARTHGMLVNNDLFEKEGLKVPTTWTELTSVCEAFRGKGYSNPHDGLHPEIVRQLYVLHSLPDVRSYAFRKQGSARAREQARPRRRRIHAPGARSGRKVHG